VSKVLNLGAGNKLIKGAVNHDVTYHRPGIDMTWDLNQMPWPWDDETFNEVYALSVLEHLRQNLAESVNEIWRITKPDGFAHIKLPYWNSATSYSDPTHLHVVSEAIFDQFDPSTKRGKEYAFYRLLPWKIVEMQRINDPATSLRWKLQKLVSYD